MRSMLKCCGITCSKDTKIPPDTNNRKENGTSHSGRIIVSDYSPGVSTLKPKFDSTLKDGSPVIIRTVNSCDSNCIAKYFQQLSSESKQSRFLASFDKLTEQQLTYLSEVDNLNHVIITASHIVDGEEQGLGLARYIKQQENSLIAELAVTVLDEQQNRGVGSLLLHVLVKHARSNGVEQLRSYTLDTNKRMVKLLRQNEFKKSGYEDGLPVYELSL